MRSETIRTAAACALGVALMTTGIGAQAPAASGDSKIVVEKPTYTTIALETTVNKPAAEVWKRVGGYCAIAEWLQIAAGCKMLSGQERVVELCTIHPQTPSCRGIGKLNGNAK